MWTVRATQAETSSLRSTRATCRITSRPYAFGGLGRKLLYANLKSVKLERVGDTIRFHPEFLAFAAHHRFEPRPVAVCRGNEKGRVERHVDLRSQELLRRTQIH